MINMCMFLSKQESIYTVGGMMCQETICTVGGMMCQETICAVGGMMCQETICTVGGMMCQENTIFSEGPIFIASKNLENSILSKSSSLSPS